MIEERATTAAILGELIPELQYAAPVLLDRLDRGLPLVNRKSPSDLGFETGTVDAQLLDLFRVLAPYVTAALGILQSWLLHNRGKKLQEELRTALIQLRTQDAEFRHILDSITGALSAAEVPVTQTELDGAIADVIARLSQEL